MIRVALPFGNGTPESKRPGYRNALRLAGIQPVEMENRGTLEGLDGLFLAGGTDIDPELYGAARAAEADEPDTARDRLEIALVREALDRDLPVFGICRGLQLLNVALGGTLIQHIDGHKRPKQRDVHGIAIVPGSRLEAVLGTREYVVNSRHHQCVGRPAPGATVTATAPDGIVEALEAPERRFILAVQWHPEARTDGPDAALFRAFRDALEVRGLFRR